MHNYIISSIIPINNTPFRPAVTEELRGLEICRRLPKFGHKTIYFMHEEINIQTNYTIFILFTQLTYV
jgi:hypothetical protein